MMPQGLSAELTRDREIGASNLGFHAPMGFGFCHGVKTWNWRRMVRQDGATGRSLSKIFIAFIFYFWTPFAIIVVFFAPLVHLLPLAPSLGRGAQRCIDDWSSASFAAAFPIRLGGR